jgi:hypothetical protein
MPPGSESFVAVTEFLPVLVSLAQGVSGDYFKILLAAPLRGTSRGNLKSVIGEFTPRQKIAVLANE